MSIITVDLKNIETEHICCALSSKTNEVGVSAKKEWLRQLISDGLKFKKLDARGKVFIEYLPVEKAWVPVVATNYMYINCHWVSGSFKGEGYGKKLLEECESEALDKEMNGVVLISSDKKRPYLSDKSFYMMNGYEVCDRADPYFELLVKRFDTKAEIPQFASSAKQGISNTKGIDIFYTAQCPFTSTYIEMLKPSLSSSDIDVRIHQIISREEAQTHFCPVTTYSVFVDGKFYTQEILNVKKLEQILLKYRA